PQHIYVGIFQTFYGLAQIFDSIVIKTHKKLKGPVVCKIQTTGPDSVELYLIIQLSSTTSRF
ncbi:hypothetical protein, partial [Phascolarctobacterium faecium]|uniref:hypothetical protein n=1 Tax=Phascolarctobacterium faecium TaxID=33025 RepID=UPI003AB5F856